MTGRPNYSHWNRVTGFRSSYLSPPRHLVRRTTRSRSALEIEYGGGLGDIFYQIFDHGGYRALSDLGPEDRARVVLVTHNPHVRELFDHHPRAAQIDLTQLDYWLPHEDGAMRHKYGLPPPPARLPRAAAMPEFFPSDADRDVLAQLDGRRYVVFSASAGMPERDIPGDLLDALVRLAIAHAVLPVMVGRNYARFDHRERRTDESGAVDLIDRLTVPGVAVAVQRSLGVVCAHSAVNMLAWWLRKPQLLLYPPSVRDGHIAARDQWAFGIDFPECRHTLFDSPDVLSEAETFFRGL